MVNYLPFEYPPSFAALPSRTSSINSGPVANLSFAVLDHKNSDFRLLFEANAETHDQKSSEILFARLLRFLDILVEADASRPLASLLLTDMASTDPKLGSPPNRAINKSATALKPTGTIESDGERHRAYTGGSWRRPRGTVLERFADQVAQTPHACALVFGEQSLSYAELDARANRLAHALIARGSRPEQVFAVCLPRGIDLIVAILAILKSGAAYLSLDVDAPRERRLLMLEDSSTRLLVTSSQSHDGSPPGYPFLLDDPAITTELAAYPCSPVIDAERGAGLRTLTISPISSTLRGALAGPNQPRHTRD